MIYLINGIAWHGLGVKLDASIVVAKSETDAREKGLSRLKERWPHSEKDYLEVRELSRKEVLELLLEDEGT